MATRTSVATGVYSADGTWDGVAPTSEDDVIIDGGYTVTLSGGAGAAASLFVKYGTLTISTQTLTVGGNCTVGANGAVTKLGSATLNVGGDLNVLAGSGDFASGFAITVDGSVLIKGRSLRITYCRVRGRAEVLGGSIINTDASSDKRLVAYGSKNLGGNTHVDFYMARGRRRLLTLNRRTYQTGLT